MLKDLVRYGNSYICVDYELKTELQNKLIAEF